MMHLRWLRTASFSCLACILSVWLIGCGRSAPQPPAAGTAKPQEHKEGNADAAHHDETSSVVELSEEAMKRAGIRVEEVRDRGKEQVLLAPAELQPNADRIAKVGPRVAGRIQRVVATLGASVRIGETLATIWSPQAAEATAVLDSARAAENLATRALARERELFERRVSAQREVLEAEAALATARAAVGAAEARLAAMGFSPSSTAGDRREPLVTITSPIGGTVIERNAAVDAPVGPDSVLFTIADLSTLWLTVRVPETNAAAVMKGQIVKVSVGAIPDRSIDGRIDYIAPVVASDTRTVDVRIQVPNRNGELRPGMSANARFDLPERAASMNQGSRVLVPRAAVQELNQATVVFVPDGERKFKAQPVTLGSSYGNDVELLSGLSVGDRFVVQGAFTLKAQALRGAVADPH